MRKLRTAEDFAKLANIHHTTLTMFAMVVTLLEGGGVYDSDANGTASRIISLCQQEEQRQLRRYDAAMAKLKEKTTCT